MLLRIPALVVCALIALAHPLAAASWSPTGPTAGGDGGDRAVTLGGGRVLVVHPGGMAERYDPATGAWSSAGSTVLSRSGFTLTALPGGNALVAGGFDAAADARAASYEVYSAATNSWAIRGPLLTARSGHIAEPLPGGRVLIAGGLTDIGPDDDLFRAFLASAEVLDPAAGTAVETGSMSTLRWPAVSARLAGGRVLVVGGYAGSSGSLQADADLYDPATGTWTRSVNEMPDPIVDFTVSALPDGRALIAGGTIPYASAPARGCAIFDPATGTFAAASQLRVPRAGHTATVLADGRVLIAGGTLADDLAVALTEAEVWYPWFAGSLRTPPLAHPRAGHAAARLANGRVLAIAGRDSGGSCELYKPGFWLIDLIQGLLLPPAAPLEPPVVLAAG